MESKPGTPCELAAADGYAYFQWDAENVVWAVGKRQQLDRGGPERNFLTLDEAGEWCDARNRQYRALRHNDPDKLRRASEDRR